MDIFAIGKYTISEAKIWCFFLQKVRFPKIGSFRLENRKEFDWELRAINSCWHYRNFTVSSVFTFPLSAFSLLQFHHRDADTTELHVFIVEMLHKRQGAKILAYKCAENAIARSVQYA